MTLGSTIIRVFTAIGDFTKKENLAVATIKVLGRKLFSNKTQRIVKSWYDYKTNYWLNVEEL